MSVVQAASEGYAWVCGPSEARSHILGLCGHQKPLGSQDSELLLTLKRKEATLAGTLMPSDAHLGKKLSWTASVTTPTPSLNSTPPKSNRPSWKPSNRTPTSCDRDAEVWLSTSDGFQCDFRWRRARVFRTWAAESLTMVQ